MRETSSCAASGVLVGDAGKDAFGIIGRSESMLSLYDQIRQAGPSSASILIVGETGTGKELVARTLHRLSPRRSRPFIAVNCAAMPETLVESELFGHEKGSFTGAVARSIGYFEQANGGTLFLDEISAMPISQQAKLLRALQEGSVRRLGGDREVEVDVRVIAAMNLDPHEAIEDSRLRSDLFYRLSVFTLKVPPLRERLSDVKWIARHFAKQLAAANGREATELHPEAVRALERHRWPGNVRELRNAIERAVIVAKGSRVTKEDLPASVSGLAYSEAPEKVTAKATEPQRDAVVVRPGMTLEEVKRQLITRTLEACGHNVSEASRRLGISSRTIYNKMREWNLVGETLQSVART